jgi:hypothetical protein
MPEAEESREEFIAKCMSSEVMKKEYSDKKQRLAVAYSQWNKKHPTDKAERAYKTKRASIADAIAGKSTMRKKHA